MERRKEKTRGSSLPESLQRLLVPGPQSHLQQNTSVEPHRTPSVVEDDSNPDTLSHHSPSPSFRLRLVDAQPLAEPRLVSASYQSYPEDLPPQSNIQISGTWGRSEHSLPRGLPDTSTIPYIPPPPSYTPSHTSHATYTFPPPVPPSMGMMPLSLRSGPWREGDAGPSTQQYRQQERETRGRRPTISQPSVPPMSSRREMLMRDVGELQYEGHSRSYSSDRGSQASYHHHYPEQNLSAQRSDEFNQHSHRSDRDPAYRFGRPENHNTGYEFAPQDYGSTSHSHLPPRYAGHHRSASSGSGGGRHSEGDYRHQEHSLPPPPSSLAPDYNTSATRLFSPPGRYDYRGQYIDANLPPLHPENYTPGPSAPLKRRPQAPPEEDPSHWSETPYEEAGGQGRKRVKVNKTAVACNFCRGRKLRCDGNKPQCFNCHNRQLKDCIYQVYIRRRGPGKAPKGSRSKKRGNTATRVYESSSPHRRGESSGDGFDPSLQERPSMDSSTSYSRHRGPPTPPFTQVPESVARSTTSARETSSEAGPSTERTPRRRSTRRRDWSPDEKDDGR